MPIGKVWMYHLLFVCLFVCVCVCACVRLRISPARIKLAALNFAWWFMGVLGRVSPILGNLAPQKPIIGRRIGARRVDLPSACVDNRQSPSLAVLVIIIVTSW